MGRHIYLNKEVIFYVTYNHDLGQEFIPFSGKDVSKVTIMVLERLIALQKQMQDEKIDCVAPTCPKADPQWNRDDNWWFGQGFSDSEIVNLKYQTLLAFLNTINGCSGKIQVEFEEDSGSLQEECDEADERNNDS